MPCVNSGLGLGLGAGVGGEVDDGLGRGPVDLVGPVEHGTHPADTLVLLAVHEFQPLAVAFAENLFWKL